MIGIATLKFAWIGPGIWHWGKPRLDFTRIGNWGKPGLDFARIQNGGGGKGLDFSAIWNGGKHELDFQRIQNGGKPRLDCGSILEWVQNDGF